MGASVAAVLVKERHIVEAFERVGAVSASRAVRPMDLGIGVGGVGWRRLRERAVIRETSPGSEEYYADLEVYQSLRSLRRRMVLVALVVVALALLAVTLAFPR